LKNRQSLDVGIFTNGLFGELEENNDRQRLPEQMDADKPAEEIGK